MKLDVDVQGLAEIERKLKLLPDRLGNNAMRRALRTGANVIRNEARKNARRIDDRETSASIWKNIAVASGGVRRERRVGGVMMRVGVQGGARLDRTAHIRVDKKGETHLLRGGNTTHWRFVEFGTSTARAQPFMRPAMGKAQAAADAITKDMRVQVDREIDKLNRQIIDLTRAAGG